MDPTHRLIEFVLARIAEDLDVAEQASSGFSIVATSQMTSPAHAAFVRRFDPAWVKADCVRMFTLVQTERSVDAQTQALRGDQPYVYPFTKILATASLPHPDFEPSWMPA